MTTTASVMFVVDAQALTDVKPYVSWQASGVEEVRRVLQTAQEIARARQEAVARGEDSAQMPWLVFAVEDASTVILDAECQRILRGLSRARRYRTVVSLGPVWRLRNRRKIALVVLAALVLAAALWAPLPLAAAVCCLVVVVMAASSTGWLDLFMRRRPR